MGLQSLSRALCHPASVAELLPKILGVKAPSRERWCLAEGIKESFLEGVGFQWDLEGLIEFVSRGGDSLNR